MRIVLLGPPGSGKGVQGELIKNRLGIPRISTGDMFREAIQKQTSEGKEVKHYMDAGQLVPDDVVIRVVRARLDESDCMKGFILDGFPRTVLQGEALDTILLHLNSKLNFVVSLEVPYDIIVGRLTSRRVCASCGKVYNVQTAPPPSNNICPVCKGTIIQRDDDKEATIRKRLEVYERQTTPLKSFYRTQGNLFEIDGTGTVESIHQSIVKVVE